MLCAALPKSGLFAVVCIGLADDTLLQAGLFSLGSVLSCSLWSVLVCSTLLYIRPVSDWSFLAVCSSAIWFGLSLSVLFAVLVLDWTSNMVAVSNAVAFLNMLGVATLFGLVCLFSVFMKSGLIVRSWSRLSDCFCPCWSGGFRAVLVWPSWYKWAGLISFESVLLCSFSLHWFGRGCSVPGRCVVVALSLVLFALFRSGVVHSALL